MIAHILRLSISSVFLAYALVCDVKKREVPDRVWLISVPAFLILDCAAVSLGSLDTTSLLSSLGISLALGFSLCFLGFYGGADAKALLLIAVATPSYPPGGSFYAINALPLPILLVFTCSTLFSASCPLTVLALNLFDFLRGERLLQSIESSRFKRLVLYIVARKVKLEKIKGSLKYFPAEKVVVEDGEVKRKPLYFVHAEADFDELVEKLEEHGELYKEGVLASPTIPMVAFLAAGFVFSNLIVVWTSL